MLTLENFEEIIDPQILQRGEQYHTSGHVQELAEVEDGVWEAVVAGTEDYDVVIEQSDEGLMCECTCPYDWGPYCKHVAAVLYAIRAGRKAVRTRGKEKQQQKESVKAILERLSHEQLVAILMEQVKKDKMLANQIALQYSQEEPDKAMYVRIIQDSLREGRDRDGFIEYSSTRRATKAVWELLNKARTLIDSGQGYKTIPLLQAVIETVTPALQYADDSDGDISGCISEAFSHLEEVVEILEGDQKRALFDYCLSEAFDPKYQGWDYAWTFLEQATELVTTRRQREALFEATDRMAARRADRDFFSEYDQEQALALKLAVMEQEDSPQEVHAFLLENVHVNDARKRLIELYIDQKLYAAAAKLCLEGIERYRNMRGLVNDYQRYLLDIAEKENNTGRVVELAERLLMESRDFDYYYGLLKKSVPTGQWPAFVEDLIKRMTSKVSRWDAAYLLGEIYAREGMWERLLALARQEPGGVLHRYREQLEKRFPREVSSMYEEIVYEGLEHTSSRERYREICALIKRIRVLGQTQQAETIVQTLKAKYPNRRAMIEELAKV